MQLSLEQARLAGQADEVPVGAVVVLNGKVIGSGYNLNRSTNDPSAHAEIIALRAAAQSIGNYRLEGANLYVSLEPCVMCAAALKWAQLSTLVFAASDPREGPDLAIDGA